MSTPKHSLDERVAEKQKQLDEMLKKVKQHEAQLKQLEARQKEEKRKKRTHKLCEMGGAILSVLDCDADDVDIDKLIFYLKEQEARGNYFSKALGLGSKEIIAEETNSIFNVD